MRNKIYIVLLVIVSLVVIFFSIPTNSFARRGCCSHHGGVCGNMCCDGTPLSPACGGSSSDISNSDSDGTSGGSYPYFCTLKNYCFEMSNCDEAMRYYTECAKFHLDSDGDGIPCENLCLSQHQENEENTGSQQGNSSNKDFQSCSIDRIIDGDTIEVQYQGKVTRVRLIGIDTPEEYISSKMINDANRCGVTVDDIKRLGLMAYNHIEELLTNSASMMCSYFGQGYYGRSLMEIYVGSTNINEQLVADGYACVYESSDLSENEKERLRSLMETASREHRGLWGINYSLMSCLCGYGVPSEEISRSFGISGRQRIVCRRTSAGPFLTDFPETTIPFGLGDYINSGVIDFAVAIPKFRSPVDVYLGILMPDYTLLVLGEDNEWKTEIRPWIRNTMGNMRFFLGSIPVSVLPRGRYTLYMLVTPAGSSIMGNDTFYILWELNVNF